MSDQNRDDAALVYRALRDHGASRAVDLASRCFPWAVEGPASSVKAIRRLSIERVFRSIVWMRGQGVDVRAVMVVSGTEFLLPRVSDPPTT